MGAILTDFGVQPVYLVAQIVNFLIVLLVLKRFMYKPILKILEDRKTTITSNLIKAEELEQQLQKIKEESEFKRLNASNEAQKITAKASDTAHQIIKEAHHQAALDIKMMLKRGKEALAQEQEKMKEETQKELINLVVLGVSQVASKVLDESDHKKIVAETIKKIKSP